MGRDIILNDQGTLEFKELGSNGTAGVTIQSTADLTGGAGAYTLTLPTTDGVANEFLQTDGSGVLTWGSSTATLQSAYDNGGKITTASAVPVEIEVGAASGNVGLLIDQDDDFDALTITKDGTGAGLGINLLNSGTGKGIFIDQDGAAIGLDIDQDGAGIAVQVNQATDNVAVDVTQAGDAAGINLLKSGVGAGTALAIENDGTGIGVDINQDGAAVALVINQATDNIGIDLTQAGDAVGLNVLKTGAVAGNAVAIENDGTGKGLFVNQDGIGIGLEVDQAAAAIAVNIIQAAAAAALDVNKTDNGAGNAVDINNAGSGYGLLVTQANVAATAQSGLRIDSTLAGGDNHALDIAQTADGHAMRLESSATSQTAFELTTTGSGLIGIDVISSSSAPSVRATTTGTGEGLVISQAGSGGAAANAARFVYSNTTAATTAAVHINSSSVTATTALQIDSGGSANYIDTDAGGGTPAHLTNGGVWTDASCFKELKRDIEPVDTRDVLDKIRKMDISRYYDKADRAEKPRRRFAPFQDDLVNLFDLDERGVSAVEVAAIALAGVKALAEEMKT